MMTLTALIQEFDLPEYIDRADIKSALEQSRENAQQNAVIGYRGRRWVGSRRDWFAAFIDDLRAEREADGMAARDFERNAY